MTYLTGNDRPLVPLTYLVASMRAILKDARRQLMSSRARWYLDLFDKLLTELERHTDTNG